MKALAQSCIAGEHIEPLELRRTLGLFATGVTVVTALDGNGVPMGMTVNSFSSVSLEPPLVLWSIAKNALGYQNYIDAEHYAIHVLAEHQQQYSQSFSARGTDKFSGISLSAGVAGLPILPEFAACFQCSAEHRYDGGDHTILVGRVMKMARKKARPLLFHGGQYAKLG